MVGGYDFVCNAQAQPEVVFAAPGFLGSVEAVEDALLVVVGDADAGIAYSDLEEIPAFLLPGERQSDPAAFRSIADGIVQQNCKDLCNAVRIAAASGQRRFRHGQGQGQMLLVAQRFESFAGVGAQGIQFAAPALDEKAVGVGMGKRQHVIDQAVHALSLFADSTEEPCLLFGGSCGAAFVGSENDGEGSAQFMGGRCDKLHLVIVIFLQRF